MIVFNTNITIVNRSNLKSLKIQGDRPTSNAFHSMHRSDTFNNKKKSCCTVEINYNKPGIVKL